MAIDATFRASTLVASGNLASAGQRLDATARTSAPDAGQQPRAGVPGAARTSAPLRRGVAGFGSGVQLDVARAQQALDYLDRVASQLEALKGQLSAKLSGSRGDEQQLEARLRQLAASLAARRQNGGDGVDSRLDFNGQPATKRFKIRSLDLASRQSASAQNLSISVGGGQPVSLTLEPGLTPEEIAQRLDRALAPHKVHAQIDERGELLFSTDEANWNAVKDSIAVSGRGRVATEEEAPPLALQDAATGNPDALRQCLREVVQALARVRQSQEAARAALGAASLRVAQASAAALTAEASQMADNFVSTASAPDYGSLLEVTSALVGVSRERVVALLGGH